MFYVGVKQVEAVEQDGPNPGGGEEKRGYAIRYPDGYVSWSPKEVFERHYLPMGDGNDGTKVTQEMVDWFIKKTFSLKVGSKTTVVLATLQNGFELIESSSCVAPDSYNHDIGTQLCLHRIKERVWHLLGFLLATGRNGVKDDRPEVPPCDY